MDAHASQRVEERPVLEEIAAATKTDVVRRESLLTWVNADIMFRFGIHFLFGREEEEGWPANNGVGLTGTFSSSSSTTLELIAGSSTETGVLSPDDEDPDDDEEGVVSWSLVKSFAMSPCFPLR